MELSEVEKAGLSANELAALEGEDDNAGVAVDEDLDADEAAAKAEADKGAADKAAADKAAADQAAADKAGVGKETATEVVAERGEFAPTYHAEAVEGYGEKLKDLDDKFEAGDLKLPEYNAQRDELLRQQIKAEISAESRTQTAEQRWDWEQERFWDDMKAKGVDVKADEKLAKQLDIAVKVLASDPENENHNGRWFLEEGLKIAQARLGRAEPVKAADPKEEPKTPEEKRAAAAAAARKTERQSDRSGIPVTLGSAPAASESEVGTESEFAALDKLSGLELERAIARLPADKQDQYARMAG